MRAVNPRTVVVLATGGPVTMPWLGSAAAVVQNYFGGQEQGSSLADVLCGDVTPQGKLTMTYPTQRARGSDRPGRTPGTASPTPTSRTARASNVGYKGYRREGIPPQFPFGYGLSYTTFAYSQLGVHAPNAHASRLEKVQVEFRVTNTGQRPGTETAEVYVGLPASTGEPPKRLVGCAQVSLAPGALGDRAPQDRPGGGEPPTELLRRGYARMAHAPRHLPRLRRDVRTRHPAERDLHGGLRSIAEASRRRTGSRSRPTSVSASAADIPADRGLLGQCARPQTGKTRPGMPGRRGRATLAGQGRDAVITSSRDRRNR